MATKLRFREIKERAKLRGKEEEHEEANSWSNRDLIPLPPSRRTWGWFHFFGYWTINSLNVSNWQSPNTFLSEHLFHFIRELEPDSLDSSLWPLCTAVTMRHCRRKSFDLLLFHLGCLVRSAMAHRLHHSEQVHLGYARQLHSSASAHSAQLHLVCRSMLERRAIDCVSRPQALAKIHQANRSQVSASRQYGPHLLQ